MRARGISRSVDHGALPGWLGAAVLLAIASGMGCTEAPKRETVWLGLNTHMCSRTSAGQFPAAGTDAERASTFELVELTGVTSIREPLMNWALVQPDRDVPYDYSITDELVRRAGADGVDLHAVCMGNPPWAVDDGLGGEVSYALPDRANSAAFSAFVKAFVERYDGDKQEDMPKLVLPVRTYEFMNRIEDYPPREYAYWLKLFRDAVKEADPGATVVLGGLRSPGLRMIDAMQGDYDRYFGRLLATEELAGPAYPYFDVVSFHAFPQCYPGRTAFDESLVYMREAMTEAGVSAPIWLTEFGHDSEEEGEQLQAESLVKWSVRARALGIERAYLYSLYDGWGVPETGARDHMGLVRAMPGGGTLAVKPAFESFAIIVDELKQRPNVVFRGEGWYMLTGAGTPTYVVWTEDAQETYQTLIPDWWEVRTLDGRSSVKQGTELEFGPSPVLIRKTQSPFIN